MSKTKRNETKQTVQTMEQRKATLRNTKKITANQNAGGAKFSEVVPNGEKINEPEQNGLKSIEAI